MTLYLKDGTERVVLFDERPADKDAITLTEWNAADDHSGQIVKPLNLNFTDSARFTFAPINVAGNGERPGKTQAAGTVRVTREYAAGTKLPDPAKDVAFIAFGTKGTTVRTGVYRGPKEFDEALAAGDEYDYMEWTTDTARVVDEDDTYIVYDIPLVFTGVYADHKVLAAAA